MNEQLVIDVLHRQLLPRISRGDFRLLPSADAAIPHSKNYQPIFPYPVHSHPFFEWVWCVENHAFLKIKEQVYRLEEGDFCLLPPGEMHADVYIPSLNAYQVLWCSYRQETINAHMHTYESVDHLQHTAGIFAVAPPFALSLLGNLQYELKTEQNYREPVCRALVSTLVHLMLRAFESSLQLQEQKHFSGKVSLKAHAYLNQHFSKPVTLTDVARALHISRNYLATLYKQETGKTIGQMLTEIRLEQAKKYLLETQLSVQTIAKAVGYATPEHFSRVFHKHEGVAPGRYGK